MANQAVYGIYASQQQVAAAIAEMKAAGFRGPDISVLLPENAGNKDLGVERHTKALEAGSIGGLTGLIVGGVVAYLIAIGTIPVAHLDDLIAAGPLMATLGGMGAGAVVGIVTGLIAGARISMYVAKRYTGRRRHGNILVSLHCDDSHWTTKAKKLLDRTGAVEVSAEEEAPGDYANTEKPEIRHFGT